MKIHILRLVEVVNIRQALVQRMQNRNKDIDIIKKMLGNDKSKHNSGDSNNEPANGTKPRKSSNLSSVFSHSSKAQDLSNDLKKGNQPDIKESKVSRKFSEQTTKRVVFLVLIVVMSEFVFQTNTYVNTLKSYSFALDALNSLEMISNLDSVYGFIKKYHQDDTDYRILEIARKVNGNYQTMVYEDPDNYREQEYEVISSGDFKMTILMRKELRFEAYLSLGKTTFILFIIMASALLISRDATALVLQPLETIMFKVNEMAEDPFQILKFNEIEAMVDDEKDKKSKDKNALYETMILDDAITKIGTLLLLGFGEAGSSLLSNHINKGETLDPKSTRKKTLAIYGF